MNPTEFKKGLTENKETLRGVTLQLINGNNVTPYTTLKGFGLTVLDCTEKGRHFCINQVWTNEGIEKVSTFKQLALIAQTKTITAVSFSTTDQPMTFNQQMRALC